MNDFEYTSPNGIPSSEGESIYLDETIDVSMEQSNSEPPPIE